MDAKVTWQGRMTFLGTADSGHTVTLGTDPSAGGDALRPTELLAISLAGCTAMDVISILQKKQQVVTAFEVRTHVKRAADYPKVFTHIHLDYLIEGRQVDPGAVERAIELSLTRYCPIHAMLEKATQIDHSYHITEASTGLGPGVPAAEPA